jgi:tetratricopeptide (TPR) repeat protein
MPKPIKKKARKKTRLDEEEVKSRALETISRLKEKRRILIYALSAVGIIVILTGAMMLYSSSVKKKAYVYEQNAYNYYHKINLKDPLSDEQRWKKSLELFQKSADIKVTPTVQFYIGNCFFHLGDYSNAVEAYQDFIDKFRHEQEILPLVYQKLVSAYLKIEKKDEAFNTMKALEQVRDGMFKDTALILQARFYESEGKQDEAQKIYSKLAMNYPLSPWSIEAKGKIEVQESKQKDTGTSGEPPPVEKEPVNPANSEMSPPESKNNQ